MDEIWKDIDGFEGLYQVSNFGRVKRLGRYAQNKLTGGMSFFKGKILKLETTNMGYYRISLSKDNRCFRFHVHRLVGVAFVANPENKPQINHINSIPKDNFYSNLEWTTQSENIKHAYKMGRKHVPIFERKKGAKNKQSKKVMQYDMNWNLINEFGGVCEAQRETGIAQSNISCCVNSTTKHAGGYRWKFKD